MLNNNLAENVKFQRPCTDPNAMTSLALAKYDGTMDVLYLDVYNIYCMV